MGQKAVHVCYQDHQILNQNSECTQPGSSSHSWRGLAMPVMAPSTDVCSGMWDVKLVQLEGIHVMYDRM